MKRLLLLCCSFLFSFYANAQSGNDTASNPYWIAMMQDRSVNFFQTQRAFEQYWSGRPILKGSGWKPFKRWEWQMKNLVDTNGNIPDIQTYIDEYRKFNLLYGSGGAGSGGGIKGLLGPGAASCIPNKGNWSELGPGYLPYNRTSQPSGVGRINDIAFHPTDSNIIWAGAPAGGLWKTSNGGITWYTTTDSMATLGISAIVINPKNTDSIYIGTGDRDHGDAWGLGVYLSSNGGKTWKVWNSGMGNQTVSRMIMHPKNTRILLAATAGGIYRSTNAGSSWSQVATGNFKDIAFNPGNPNTVYATSGGAFYKSWNNGVSWSAITSGLPSGAVRGAIAVTPADTSYVYLILTNSATYYGTYRSVNSGNSFSTRSTTPNIMDYSTNGSGSGGQAWYDLDIACDPQNRDIVFVGGVNIFKSTDGAATWTISAHWIGSSSLASVHADQHRLVFSPVSKKLYAGNDGGVYITTNKGSTWKDLSNSIGVSALYKIGASSSVKDLFIGGFQDNGTAYFNGDAWSTIRGGDGMDCAWDQSDANYSYGALYYGSITRFYRGSHDATVANNGVNGINESGDWVTPYVLKADNSSTMFIGYKNIWRSSNIKASPPSFSRLTNNSSGYNYRILENSPRNPDILYASRWDNKLFRSYNAGGGTVQWRDISSFLPNTGTPSAIEAHPLDSNTVFIGHNNKVYRSRNKGLNWTDISGNLPAVPVNCIVFDTSNNKQGMYVGTFTGVYYKDTTMANWVSFNDGIPINASVTDLEIYHDPRGRGFSRIYASTFGRGTWRSSLYDYALKIPKTDFVTIMPKECDSKVYEFKADCANNPTRHKWYITPGTYSYADGTDSMSENLRVVFNKTGYYSIRLASENCYGTDTLVKNNLIIIFDTAKRASCITTTTNLTDNYGIGINEVELTGLRNSSSGAYDEGSNADFSCRRTFNLKTSSKYPLKVITGPYYNEYVRIYIDYNNNGVLTDAGEMVYSTYNRIYHLDTLRTPANAVRNTVLRMRVVSDYYNITGPCTALGYGQSEDYGVYFDDPQALFAVAEDSLCIGTKAVFTDQSQGNVYSYLWDFGQGAVPAQATGKGPHNVNYTNAGFKKVKLTINGTVTYSKDSAVLIKQYPNLKLLVGKGSLAQCAGDSLRIVARDSNHSAQTYQWQKNSSNIGWATDSGFNLNKHSLSDAGTYRCIATNLGCTDTSNAVVFVVYPQPRAGYTFNPATQCLKGNQFSFTDTSTLSAGTYKRTWYFGDNTTDSVISPKHKYNTHGTYSVKLRVTSDNGCRDSVTKSLTVHPQPVPAFQINDSTQCLNGNQFVFNNKTTIPQGTFTSSWDYGDGSQMNNTTQTSTSNTYMLIGYFPVTMTVKSDKGCTETLVKSITVYENANISFTVNDSNQCFRGHRFNFTNLSNIGSGAMSYQWRFGDGQQNAGTNPVHIYGNPGTYAVTLKVNTSNNCTDSLIRQMVVHPSPSVAFTANDSSQCKPINNFIFNNNTTIAYGTMSYNWLFGDGNFSTNTQPSHSYAATGLYQVRLIGVSDKQCADTVFGSVRVYNAPKASFTVNNDNQCRVGNNFTFANTSVSYNPLYTCLFNFGDGNNFTGKSANHSYTSAGSYKVILTATVKAGCEDTVSQIVRIHPNPAAGFTVSPNTQCLNENHFSFANTSTGAISRVWHYGDISSDTSLHGSHSYSNAGKFIVTLISRSDKGCNDTAQGNILVNASPQTAFTPSSIAQCLLSNYFTFTNNTVISSGSYSSQWHFGDTGIVSSKDAAHSYAFPGVKTVSLICRSDSGCADTLYRQIRVYPQPDAAFSVSQTDLETRRFVAQNGNYQKYEWHYGDGQTGNGDVSKHQYGDSLTGTVTLIVEDIYGCRDTAYQSIRVQSPVYRNIPNSNNAYIYPNPSTGQIQLKFVLQDEDNVSFAMYDDIGKLILSESENIKPKGIYVYTIDFETLGLSRGVYHIYLLTGKGKIVEKVVYQ